MTIAKRSVGAAVVLGYLMANVNSFLVKPQGTAGQGTLGTWPVQGDRVSTLSALAADAEKESTKLFERGEWKRTRNGGFLPNFLPNFGRARNLSLQQQLQEEEEQQPKTGKVGDILEIKGLNDFKQQVVDEKNQMVCARFYAPYCRACRAVAQAFRRLPKEFPNIKFVEVPLGPAGSENAHLLQGLGIPSLPYAHLFHPDVGLVEERKIGKKDFKQFREEILKSYYDGFCELKDGVDEEDNTGDDHNKFVHHVPVPI